MIYIDKFAYVNKLRKVHPMEKTLFAIITLGITLAANSIIIYGLVFSIITLLLLFYAGIPAKFYFRLLLVPTYFIAAAVLTLIVTRVSLNERALLTLSMFHIEMGVTADNLLKGVSLFMRTMAAVSCMYFLTLTVGLTELVQLLRRIKLPDLFLELVILIYRFIFLLFETMDKIHTSQVSRLSGVNFQSRFWGLVKTGAALFVISMKRYEDTYNAMESRLYSGQIAYLEKKYSYSAINLAGIVIIELFLLYLSLTLQGEFKGIPWGLR